MSEKEFFKESLERGTHPEGSGVVDWFDNPVLVTITLEQREYEFLQGLCDGSDSFFSSVQRAIGNLVRGCARDGYDLEFLQSITDQLIKDDPSKKIKNAPEEKFHRMKTDKNINNDDELPF